MTYLLQRLLWYDMWLCPLRPLKTMSTMCQKSKEKYASCVIVPYWYSNLVYYALDTIFSCNNDCSSYNSLCNKKKSLLLDDSPTYRVFKTIFCQLFVDKPNKCLICIRVRLKITLAVIMIRNNFPMKRTSDTFCQKISQFDLST